MRQIFDHLNVQGLSYRAVCATLLEQRVEISHQALRSWHLRKMRKIASRSRLSAGVSIHMLAQGPSNEAAQMDLASKAMTLKSRPESAQSAPPFSRQASKDLFANLDQEERLLSSAPGFPIRERFLVRGKEPDR
jgi:hypothetical protein